MTKAIVVATEMKEEGRMGIAAGVGGHRALEFANTAGWHLSAEPQERLLSWKDVAHWAAELQLIAPAQLKKIVVAGGDVGRLIALREDIFAVGLELARHGKPDQAIVDRIARAAGLTSPIPAVRGNGIAWTFDPALADEQLATCLAREALSLFCTSKAVKITLCEGVGCGWLFIDDSRSGRRRWCSMSDCGARAKARRHYQRTKKPERESSKR